MTPSVSIYHSTSSKLNSSSINRKSSRKINKIDSNDKPKKKLTLNLMKTYEEDEISLSDKSEEIAHINMKIERIENNQMKQQEDINEILSKLQIMIDL